MKVGQLLIFTGNTFHKSGANISDQVRYSLVGMYHDINPIDFMAPKIQFKFRTMDTKKYYEEVVSEWRK